MNTAKGMCPAGGKNMGEANENILDGVELILPDVDVCNPEGKNTWGLGADKDTLDDDALRVPIAPKVWGADDNSELGLEEDEDTCDEDALTLPADPEVQGVGSKGLGELKANAEELDDDALTDLEASKTSDGNKDELVMRDLLEAALEAVSEVLTIEREAPRLLLSFVRSITSSDRFLVLDEDDGVIQTQVNKDFFKIACACSRESTGAKLA